MVISHKVTSISPGKAILFGEHFVVYGYSSLIFAIDKRFRVVLEFGGSDRNSSKISVTSNLGFSAEIVNSKIIMPNSAQLYVDVVNNLHKIISYLLEGLHDDGTVVNKQSMNVHIDSEIPVGGGLGSSSAFCVALTGALYCNSDNKPNKKLICDKSIEVERVINNSTSGVDCSICTYGGLGVYNKSRGFKKIGADIHDLPFLVIDTGIPHNTSEMVNKVKKVKENDAEYFSMLCKQYESIFGSSLKSLKTKNLESLGTLMDENHSILKKLSLSNPVIEKVIKICQSGGTYGTKITGSGGGGCLLSLVDKKDKTLVKRLLKKLDELKLNYFFVNPDDGGIKIEMETASNAYKTRLCL
ncbi:MAG: mevalonate kinase [Candidatus Nitrosocosmicus sp.]